MKTDLSRPIRSKASGERITILCKGNKKVFYQFDDKITERANLYDEIDDYFENIPLASGHNPLGLTDEEVGEGFRLLNMGETSEEYEYRTRGADFWKPCTTKTTTVFPDYISCYRVKREPVKVMVALEAKDIPLLSEIQNKRGEKFLVLAQNDIGVGYCYMGEIPMIRAGYSSYTEMKDDGWNIRRTNESKWMPCEKEASK